MADDFYSSLDDQPEPTGPFSQAQTPLGHGRLIHTVEQNGQIGSVDDHALTSQLQKAGYQVKGVSSDGSMFTIQTGPGPNDVSQMSATDILQKLGANVRGTKPTNANYDYVDPHMRYLINMEGVRNDDSMKKTMLTEKMRQKGMEDPQIVGQGQDWYAFDPGTQVWYALTDKPGLNSGDAIQYGMAAPHFIGSALGMGAGAAAGATAGALAGGIGAVPGGIAGGAAGGVGGGLMGNAAESMIERGINAATGETEGLNYHPGGAEELNSIMGSAPADAITGGVGGSVPGLLQMGPVSRAVSSGGQLLGKAATAIGKGFQALGGNSTGAQVAQEFAGSSIPGINPMLTTGEALKTPGYLAEGLSKAPGWLGETSLMKNLNPEWAAKLRGISSGLLKTSAEGVEPSTQSIAQNASEMLGKRATAQSFANPGPKLDRLLDHAEDVGFDREGFANAFKTDILNGRSAEQLIGDADTAGVNSGLVHEALQEINPGPVAEEAFRSGGSAIQGATDVGDALTGVGRGAIKYGANATGAAFRGIGAVGKGSAKAANLLGGLETPSYLNLGSEELLNRNKKSTIPYR